MELFRKQQNDTQGRGGTVKAVGITGRRVALSPYEWFRALSALRSADSRGFTLIELVMTITIMTILTIGVIPLLKVSVKRQKEQQLRDALRQMRIAIDEFRRDTVGMERFCTGTAMPPQQPQPGGIPVDPRSKVVISDCTIFGVDNPDRYPPDLETLVSGVNVVPRGLGTGHGDPGVKATDLTTELSTKKKVYLRGIPIDPMTGKTEWDLRSCYDAADAGSWGGENVFDVRSKSRGTALNGDKYSDW
ncbi:MAG TPA: prepilin-type N-terminal cleavage/methylation domain-containing protein [Pyrinomonadaceae bacterium]|nr:prepilin-type N-terminal cleavage/methylation domain-containing protein [Pyrinomonadaceae bacterium]